MPVLCGKPISAADAEALNAIAGFPLPQSYLAWILGQNGLYISGSDYVDLPFDKVDDGQISFSALFGLNISNTKFDLAYSNSMYREDLDFMDEVFIIGDDPGGNFYLLIRNQSGEPVYYWDRTHIHMLDASFKPDIMEQNECGNLYLFSDSFEDFLSEINQHTGQMHRVVAEDWPSDQTV